MKDATVAPKVPRTCDFVKQPAVLEATGRGGRASDGPQEAAPAARRFISPYDTLRRLVDNSRTCE